MSEKFKLIERSNSFLKCSEVSLSDQHNEKIGSTQQTP
jgi:hypothetical protein